jgi:hypothetical protein
MAVGGAGDVAGRHVHHGCAVPSAVREHIRDAQRVDGEGFFEGGLEVDEPRAVNHRVERAALNRIGTVGNRAFDSNIAGDDFNFAFDKALEARAEMLAQRPHHGRIKHLAAEAIQARTFVAADQQVDTVEFGMPSEEQVEKDLAEKAGCAGQQDGALAQRLLNRRHRGRAAPLAVQAAVAIRHRR